MLSAADAKKALKLTFPDRVIVDITRKCYKSKFNSVLSDALEHDEVLYVIRRSKTTNWFFAKTNTAYNCLLVVHRIIARVTSPNFEVLKPLLDRVNVDASTVCCVCLDDYANDTEIDITNEVIQDVINSVVTDNVGVCCSRCGNYVCNDCTNKFVNTLHSSISVCPVCSKNWT